MSNLFMPTQGPGYGLSFASHDRVRCMNRSTATLVVGKLVAFDLEGDDADSTTWTPGATTSCTANVVTPTAGQIAATEMTVFAIVTSLLGGTGADNTEIEVLCGGLTKGYVVDSGTPAAMTAGSPMVGLAARNLEIDEAGSGTVIALLAEASTTFSSTAKLADVMFFGWRGLWATT